MPHNYEKIVWRSLDIRIMEDPLECKRYLILLAYDIMGCRNRIATMIANKQRGQPISAEYLESAEKALDYLHINKLELELRFLELTQNKNCDKHKTCDLHVVRINYNYYRYLKEFKKAVKKLDRGLYKIATTEVEGKFNFKKKTDEQLKKLTEEQNS